MLLSDFIKILTNTPTSKISDLKVIFAKFDIDKKKLLSILSFLQDNHLIYFSLIEDEFFIKNDLKYFIIKYPFSEEFNSNEFFDFIYSFDNFPQEKYEKIISFKTDTF